MDGEQVFSEDSDDSVPCQLTFNKMSRTQLATGYREGASAGRENSFQAGFDLGYASGYQGGHALGLSDGLQRTLRVLGAGHVPEPTMVAASRGACVMCGDAAAGEGWTLRELMQRQEEANSAVIARRDATLGAIGMQTLDCLHNLPLS